MEQSHTRKTSDKFSNSVIELFNAKWEKHGEPSGEQHIIEPAARPLQESLGTVGPAEPSIEQQKSRSVQFRSIYMNPGHIFVPNSGGGAENLHIEFRVEISSM